MTASPDPAGSPDPWLDEWAMGADLHLAVNAIIRHAVECDSALDLRDPAYTIIEVMARLKGPDARVTGN